MTDYDGSQHVDRILVDDVAGVVQLETPGGELLDSRPLTDELQQLGFDRLREKYSDRSPPIEQRQL